MCALYLYDFLRTFFLIGTDTEQFEQMFIWVYINRSFESEKKFKKDSTQYWTEFFQTKNDQDELQETVMKGLMK